MTKIPRGYGLPHEELASTIEALADRIAEGDRSFELQVLIQTIEGALLELENTDGLILLNRIGLLLITDDGRNPTMYEFVQKQVESMDP